MTYTTRVATSLVALLAVAPLSCQTAIAQSFTVLSGQTRTTTQTMAGNGNVGIVEAGGSIGTTFTGGDGISSSGINGLITQSGSISTAGLQAYGIYSTGAGVRIDQTGTTTTTGYEGVGFGSSGADAWITNSGSISTMGYQASGIYSTGAGARVSQSGSISTAGALAYGITIVGSGAQVVQSGTITTTGAGASGITLAGANAQLTNSGTIKASGNVGYGITMRSANAQITNSGVIQATGTNARALSFEPGALSNALTLANGSRIEGLVYVDNSVAGTMTLNLQSAQSSVVQFENTMPGTINGASGLTYAIDAANLRLLSADVTLQQQAGNRLDALLSGTFGALAARGGIGAGSTGFAPMSYVAPVAASAAFAGFDAGAPAATSNIWASGFGGKSGLGTSYGFGGLIIGADTAVSWNWTAGLLTGASRGQSVSGADRIDEGSVFFGAYGQGVFNDTTLDLALLLGRAGFDSSRAVSTIAGMQTATASYGAFFLSPELGVTHNFDAGGQTIEVGGSLRYASIFIDGYTETGSLGNLTVDARAVHQLSARAYVAVPFESSHGDGSLTRITPRLGVEATSQFGADMVGGAIAGSAVSFSANTGGRLLGFAGLRFEHETAGNLVFSGDVEAGLDRNGSARILASAGFKAQF